MADRQQQHPENVWERLRRNRTRNAGIFAGVGIRPENARDVSCPSCGARESAIFWATTRHRGKMLHLLCPLCEKARVRYDLASNRPVDPVFTRGTVGGGMGMIGVFLVIGALFLFRDTPPVQMLAEDLHALREAVGSRASGATGGVIGAGSGATASSRPTRSAGAGRGSSAGGSTSSGSTRAQASRSAATPASTPTGPAAGSSGPAAAAPAAPAAGIAAEAPVRVYVSRGDRRDDVDGYAARIIERRGEREMRLLLQIEYDPDTDVTRLVVDTGSSEWPRRLTWLRGWRRADP
jgi:hypothetical protein